MHCLWGMPAHKPFPGGHDLLVILGIGYPPLRRSHSHSSALLPAIRNFLQDRSMFLQPHFAGRLFVEMFLLLPQYTLPNRIQYCFSIV